MKHWLPSKLDAMGAGRKSCIYYFTAVEPASLVIPPREVMASCVFMIYGELKVIHWNYCEKYTHCHTR